MLIVAGLLEAIWAVGLNMAMAMRNLPVGTAYAVWVSIGIFGTVIAQPLLFHQPLRLVQVFFLMLLIGSVIGLKVTTK